ncbi:hypothetical protein ORI20_02930 [Mycobacterium sp. CVI_P3]|uniref:Uncharacterized protein n=1 Tax=Mycobacterium pinniadriaticum TaxID=2994102 RepID=A0ABT3S809_9MYCO|nr:hypothetical protein [Mycobacterium pinniadriaticum]MCX2929215.1 hypothetical protein [Mycobacterium pinniadriaticum]MCX2935640.1 hypothetical protein [Mycobacterium pinniadriaticum]
MRIVVVMALAGLIALLVAILTDNAFVAVGVVVLAGIGILLLLRDWRADRRPTVPAAPVDDDAPDPGPVDPVMLPEMFAPDISADGRGPSADARTD